MAKLKGLIKIQGTVGDLTFYKSQDGYIVKEKTDFDKEKYDNDKAYARSRENANEFGTAGKATKLFRAAFRELIVKVKDNRLSSRLTKKMMQVVQADATSTRGQRNVIDGETELLEGFECNANAILSSTIYAPYTATIDRVTGTLAINVPAFIPENDIIIPEGATHFKMVSGGAELDFENETHVSSFSESAFIPYDETTVPAITLSNVVTANSTHPLILIMGLQFYQLVNGVQYPLKNGAFNALTVIKVSGV